MRLVRLFIKVVSALGYFAVKKWKFDWRLKVDKRNLVKAWITVKVCGLLPPSEEKNELLREAGFKIGKGVFISPDVVLDPIYPEMVDIEEGAFLGWGVRVFAHIITPEGMTSDRVIIGKDAFIGGFTTVRPGVIVGNRAYIGSDSLVNKSIPDGKKAYGIPAKVISEDIEVGPIESMFQ